MAQNTDWINFVNLWHKRKNAGRKSDEYDENGIADDLDIEMFLKTLCRSFDISVPVTVTPFAVPGEPETKCAEGYEVNPVNEQNEDGKDVYKFTVTQKMNINIPMLFGVEICFDKTCAEDGGECRDEDKQ